MRHREAVKRLTLTLAFSAVISLMCSVHVFASQRWASPAGNLPINGLNSSLKGWSQRGTTDCIGCIHDEALIQRWSIKHFPLSYAGTYYQDKGTSRLVVGFTERQGARVRAIRRLPGLVRPKRVSMFPYIPEYSLGELGDLQQRILDNVRTDKELSEVFVSVGIVVKVNQVDVGSENPKRARQILHRLYGSDAPVRVSYEETPVELLRATEG